MDAGSSLDVAPPEALRHEIEATRAALGSKLHALNHEIRGTVAGASERVKRSLHDAREEISPATQFHRHPLAFCACAFAAGFLWRSWRPHPSSALADAAPAEARQARARRPTEYPPLSRAVVPLIVDVLRGFVRRP